ncbi:MAG: hypothetical protein JJE39_16380 [Vicinamibacteria bacterium]|nr:hypothetical protein [Vicinamibacteria bacterium]
MSEPLERNKQNVLAFYDLMFNQCQPAEAVRRYTGEAYIQHNPAVGDRKAAFSQYFERRDALARFQIASHLREGGVAI